MAAVFSGDLLVIGGEKGGDLLTWDTVLRKPGKAIPGKQQGVYLLSASADGGTLASFGSGPRVAIWKAANSGAFRLVRTSDDYHGGALSPDGRLLANYNLDTREIDLWDITSGKAAHHLRLPEVNHPVVSALAFSPDGTVLAAGYNRGVVRPIGIVYLWDVRSGRKIAELGDWDAGTAGVLFSPDGRTLAVSRPFFGVVEFWEVASRQVRHRIKENFLNARGAFSPDGLAFAIGDETIRVRDIATGKLLCELKGSDSWVTEICFSSDGKMLATAAFDGSVILWDVARLGSRPPAPKVALDGPELRDLWADLARADAAVAYQAIARLSRDPERSIPFLGQRLRPVPAVPEAVTAPLIRQLDSNVFAERKQAVEALERLGEAARAAVRRAAQEPPSAEVKHQLTRLLKQIDGFPPPADRLRALRAVEALERMGTPEARRVLEGLATGAADAPLTRDARGAVGRLRRRASRT